MMIILLPVVIFIPMRLWKVRDNIAHIDSPHVKPEVYLSRRSENLFQVHA